MIKIFNKLYSKIVLLKRLFALKINIEKNNCNNNIFTDIFNLF